VRGTQLIQLVEVVVRRHIYCNNEKSLQLDTGSAEIRSSIEGNKVLH
jgi:hypothetical protein